MRGLPRQLSVDELAELFSGRTAFVERLAELFEGRTRFVELLAERENPLGVAREVARTLTDDEKKAVLDAHSARRNAAAGVEDVRRDHHGIFHCRAAVDKKTHSRRYPYLRGPG